MNSKGLAQNENEATLSSYHDISYIMAQVFDKHPKNEWIEMELARKLTEPEFNQIVGFTFKDFVAAIGNYALKTDPQKRNSGSKSIQVTPLDPKIEETMWENEFVYDIFNYIGNYGTVHVPDLQKLDSYGIVKREGHDTIVIIDYGLSDDVWNKHYQR
jgi:hypothetical protein